MLRFNSFTADYKNVRQDENGFLYIKNARPMRAGVTVYLNAAGEKVRELIPEEEVFNAESMSSLSMKPFTIEHEGLFIDSEKAEKYSVGMVGENITRDGEYLNCSIAIHNKKGVDRIAKKGVLGLSTGYKCKVDPTSGVHPKYGPYDAIQREIRHNHLTNTINPRIAGSEIRLNADTAFQLVDEAEIKPDSPGATQEKEEPMKVIQKQLPAIEVGEFRLNSVNVDVPEDVVEKFNTLEARLNSTVEALTESNKKTSELQAKLDKAEADAKETSEKLNSMVDSSTVKALVIERADLIAKASEFRINGADTMENDSIKKEVCKAYGKFDAERLNSDVNYLNVAYDMVKSDDKAKERMNSKRNLQSVGVDVDASLADDSRAFNEK